LADAAFSHLTYHLRGVFEK